MAKDSVTPKAKATDEEAELAKLLQEEEDKKAQEQKDAESAALRAAEMHAAAAAAAVQAYKKPEPKAAPVVRAGDIPVICLKTEAFVSLGDRRYNFKKGNEIMMDPGHASEMEASGWVALVTVVKSE